jgi:hypothetical protein
LRACAETALAAIGHYITTTNLLSNSEIETFVDRCHVLERHR